MGAVGEAGCPLRARQYTMEEELGRGAFGRALLVRNADGIPFVAKEVDTKGMLARDIQDSKNEVKVLASLGHPNITRYVDSFEAGSRIYTVMEYADGGDLSRRIRRQAASFKDFSEDFVCWILIQICSALQYLHEQRYLHRDIKAQNIFLTSSNIVKLGDFGVSKHVGSVGVASTVCGTYSYFSPEMCQRKPYSSKSDLFALGVVLYEMLSNGRKPFEADSVPSLIARIAKGSLQPLPKGLPFSSELTALCLQLLSTEPSQRPSASGVLASPAIKARLKATEKRAMLTQQAADGGDAAKAPPPQKLFGKLFGAMQKRKENREKGPAPPSPGPKPAASNAAIRVDKAQMALMLQKEPASYKAELDAMHAAKNPKAASPKKPYSNVAATRRDCEDLLRIARELKNAKKARPITDDLSESPAEAKERVERMKEHIVLQIGLSKMKRCLEAVSASSVSESDGQELNAKLAGILGEEFVPMVPFIIDYFGNQQSDAAAS
ncbi:putative serine/threonine-protein kinase nek3 [Diplonema papillatum]|nr:putative serine/threonine-protein kinase nek3 [Diplonema papillatum]